MFKKKRLLAAGLVMAMAFTGCGDKEGADPTPVPTQPSQPTQPPATSTPAPTDAPESTPTTAPVPTEAPSYEAGKVVDFEDGNFSFVAVKESLPTSAETELSVVDFGGSKALQIKAEDTKKFPYVAIDISSLAGDAIESVRTIEMDMGLASPDGTFYAASGNIYYYVGEDNAEKSAPWSVYLAVKNPKRNTMTLEAEESFKAGAKNLIIITKETDNAIASAGATNTVYIDNIVLKDADGNAIALDTAAAFDAPDGFGDEDWSNLVQVKDEVDIAGMAGTNPGSWWPGQGITVDPAQDLSEGNTSLVDDASVFGPGMIMTIYMNFDFNSLDEWQRNIKLVGQYFGVEGSEIAVPSWEDFNIKDVADMTSGVDDKTGLPTKVFNIYALPMNDSRTMAQISYDKVAEYLGDTEWFKHINFLGIADYGFALDITRVTVGYEKKVLPPTVNNTEIEGFNVKGAGWAQAGVQTVAGGGTFDVSLLKPGCVVTIDYKSEGDMWLVASPVEGMEAPYGWTRIAQNQAAKNDDNNQCQITYDQIVAALGTDDFSALGKLECESDQEWEVYSVSVGEYAPDALKFTDEVMFDNSGAKAAGWAQAGVDTDQGNFDYTLLVPGSVINVYYKDNGANYWLVAVPGDGAPYAWSRVGNGDNDVTSRMDPKKGIMQITYDQLVAALKTEDFSTMYALQVESSEEWEIYGIGVAKLAE